eukprot:TRINITY_DN2809_c0_g1_i1.p1 TRINITY_DN2809_c0_g1~~TRINITY_DN2809_c0_g1_i1.p1  ORF type:complete len:684 (-),score=154.67 TRINITY_DN2809_c0_g1_i1:1400-3451(-)
MPRKSKKKSESSDSSSSDDSSSESSSSSSSSSESNQKVARKSKDRSQKRKKPTKHSSSSSSSSSSSDSDSSDEEMKSMKKRRKVNPLSHELDTLEDQETPDGHQANQIGNKSSRNPSNNKQEESIDVSMLPGWMQRAHVISATDQIPLEDLARTGIISNQIVDNLKNMGVDFLFPVQTEVIPFVIRGSVVGQDVAVSAPTGSGKTLAYAIPIVHVLSSAVLRRLRALILVPTRELVSQVYNVFKGLIKGMNLRCEALYGDKSFAEEQTRLVNPETGDSLVDIVICTPGRLVDHLQSTTGFTLQHLRFLVADEADRLLMQSYQDWLAKVLAALHTKHTGTISYSEDGTVNRIDVATERDSYVTSSGKFGLQFPPLQKMLFSATLTHNPKKIASLQLVNPHFFTAVASPDQHLFKMPSTLKQNLIVCKEELKPLILLHLLENVVGGHQVLCFTSSVEATHRLVLLLEFIRQLRQQNADSAYLKNLKICEYSSNLSQAERDRILTDVRGGKPIIVVCSDVMSRGLDSQEINVVINYDAPPFLKTYVHRVGRTARAGRAGACYSLLRKEEARFFKQMLLKAENSKQHEIKLDSRAVVKPVERYYQDALQKLKDTLDAERLAGAAGISPSQNQTSNTQNKTKIASGHSQTPQKTKERAADADAEKASVARKDSAKSISQSLRVALLGQ